MKELFFSGRMTVIFVCLLLAVGIVLCGLYLGSSRGARSTVLEGSLMSGIRPSAVETRPADAQFLTAAADFAVGLLRETSAEGENPLCSPDVLYRALAMTANGASGSTLSQMQSVLGGGMDIKTLNTYMSADGESADGRPVQAAAIWFRDAQGVEVSREFLQVNADRYAAAASKAPFDASTVGEINTWVREKTGGRIESVVDDISENSMMFLVTAVSLDASWQTPYSSGSVHEGQFFTENGETLPCTMMESKENLFISGNREVGFIKPYTSGCCFVALLPEEGVAMSDYLSELTGGRLMSLIASAKPEQVSATLPRFSVTSDYELSGALRAMGMTDAFDPDSADFTAMGAFPDRVFIDSVTHKAFIAVDELGTKAGAAASVEMATRGMPLNVVCLDRPFVYAIIDSASGLPYFIGVLTAPQA